MQRDVDRRGAPIGIRLEHQAQRRDQPPIDLTTERAFDVDSEALVRQVFRLLAADQTERGGADGVHVAGRRGATLKLLGRHEAEGTDDGAAALRLQTVAHRAKIDQAVRAVGAQDDVAGLDVAMHDRRRVAVQVTQALGRIAQEAHDLLVIERDATLAARRERLALDLFHHQVEGAVLFEMFDVARQVGVVERRQHRRFTLGQLDVFPRLGAANREALDRDRPPLALVDRLERLAL